MRYQMRMFTTEAQRHRETLDEKEAQLLTYLKLSGKCVGLLINFNTPVLTRGIRRIVL